ncbi:MAG: tetratricopeptide repeat protein [Elusimicrobiota bacterium]
MESVFSILNSKKTSSIPAKAALALVFSIIINTVFLINPINLSASESEDEPEIIENISINQQETMRAYLAGDWDALIELNGKWSDAEPSNPLPHLFRGIAYYFKNMPEEAVKEYNEGTKLNAQSTSYLTFMKKAVKNNPENEYAWLALGDAYLASGNYNKAIKTLEKTIEMNKKSGMAYMILGMAYSRKGDNEKGEAAYLDGIKKAPSFVKNYINLGVFYESAGKPEKALKYYVKGLKFEEKQKKTVFCHYKLGAYYQKNNQREKAKDILARGFNIRKDNYWLNLALGDIYIEDKDFLKAEELYNNIIETSGNCVGCRDKALEELERIRELKEGNRLREK